MTTNDGDRTLEVTGAPDEALAFGKQLRKWLDTFGMTQADLAEKAETTAPIVSSIIHGRRQVGIKLATRLADALDLKDNSRERLTFLSSAKRSKFKGFDHEEFGVEAILYDLTSKALTRSGMDLKQVQSIVPLDPMKSRETAVVVMKDGSLFRFTLQISRQEAEPLPQRHEPAEPPRPSATEAEILDIFGDVNAPPPSDESNEDPEPSEPPQKPEADSPPKKPRRNFKDLLG